MRKRLSFKKDIRFLIGVLGWILRDCSVERVIPLALAWPHKGEIPQSLFYTSHFSVRGVTMHKARV